MSAYGKYKGMGIPVEEFLLQKLYGKQSEVERLQIQNARLVAELSDGFADRLPALSIKLKPIETKDGFPFRLQ